MTLTRSCNILITAMKITGAIVFLLISAKMVAGCPELKCTTDNGIYYHNWVYGANQVAYVPKIDSFHITLYRPIDCGGIQRSAVIFEKDTIYKNNMIFGNRNIIPLVGNIGSYEVVCTSVTEQHFYFSISLNPVGINNLDLNNKILVYPNPATDLIYLSTEFDGINIRIYDITGKEVFYETSNSDNTKIPLHEFPKGIYFLQAESIDGKIYKKKFLKL